MATVVGQAGEFSDRYVNTRSRLTYIVVSFANALLVGFLAVAVVAIALSAMGIRGAGISVAASVAGIAPVAVAVGRTSQLDARVVAGRLVVRNLLRTESVTLSSVRVGARALPSSGYRVWVVVLETSDGTTRIDVAASADLRADGANIDRFLEWLSKHVS